MLLMQILSSLVRQWRDCRTPERVFIALLIVGLVLSLVAPAFYGSLLVAVTFGLIVLSRTGFVASRYQKRVTRAVMPLYDLRSEERKRDSDLQELFSCVVNVQPPVWYAEEHARLVQVLRELLEARQLRTTHQDMRRYAVAAIALRRAMNSWLQRKGEPDSDEYTHEICSAIATYYAKDDAIAAERHQIFSSTIASLREITPPAHRAAVHQDLIRAIQRMDKLTTHQRVCLTSADEAGVVSTAVDFAASGASMQGAIKQVRGWK